MVPVLREGSILRSAIDHLDLLRRTHLAHIVVVTTQREVAEAASHPDAADTLEVARTLAREGRVIHLHYDDPLGVKGDQLNFAVARCRELLQESFEDAFVLVYDADSRPPTRSLSEFSRAICNNPTVDVFHQSSVFEVRGDKKIADKTGPAYLRRMLVESGALRANRFVLAYELPRLLSRAALRGPLRRTITSYVYTHVTGHGLCIRASLLKCLPFPARSPLEDMHYSFILGSHNIAMVPIPSLDSAEVPPSLQAQFEQAASWFQGPARFAQYFSDDAIRSGPRAWSLALTAAAISLEWLSCAFMPALLFGVAMFGTSTAQLLATAILGLFLFQLLVTELVLGSSSSPGHRLGKLVVFPIVVTLFGIAGWVGALKLLVGGSFQAKTERQG